MLPIINADFKCTLLVERLTGEVVFAESGKLLFQINLNRDWTDLDSAAERKCSIVEPQVTLRARKRVTIPGQLGQNTSNHSIVHVDRILEGDF